MDETFTFDYGSTGGYDFTFDPGGSTGLFDATTDPTIPAPDLSTVDIPVYTDTPDLSVQGTFKSGWDLTDIVADVQSVFKAALAINAAYKSASQPAVRASTPETTANPNGTLTTKTSTGGTVTARMSTGVPYMTTGGVMVVNNGNGTYTVTNADGTQTTVQYPAVVAQRGDASNGLLWLAAIGGGLFLLSRRK